MEKVNIEMKRYGFVEGKAFDGLMPKLMERVGEKCCTGESDVVVAAFDPTANGVDAMKVISRTLVAEQ